MNKSIEGMIEKRLMEYAYTVTGYMGNEEIKSGCIPKAIIKKVAGNVADDLKKQYKVIANAEVTGFCTWSEGNGKTKALYLHTTNGDLKMDDLHTSEALELDGKQVKLILREVK